VRNSSQVANVEKQVRALRNFLHEFKARGVLKVATAYLVVSWLALEIGHTLFNIFELPHGGLQLIFVLLAAGFPVVLLGSWQGWFGPAQEQASARQPANTREGPWLAAVFGVVAIFAVALVIGIRFFGMGHSESGRGHAASPTSATDGLARSPASVTAPFNPPPHSVAVLSFANMSGDAKDEYFSDGLSEELLNTLVRINGLQVAARTSSFSFKGTAADVPTVGRKLNVGAVLEGSVRKAGERVRITAQLINAISGYHLWSQTYDRDLKDIFALQTEIASAVAAAMKVTLLGDAKQRLSDGGTRNPDAFDAYLRGRKAASAADQPSLRAAVGAFDEAIALDPAYALAYARRGEALALLANDWVFDPTQSQQLYLKARASADKAIAMAPGAAQGYGSLATVLSLTTLDYRAIDTALRRSVNMEPGNAELQSSYANFTGRLGRADALDAANRAITLNPLDALAHRGRGRILLYARRFAEARASFREALRLEDSHISRSWVGWNELAAGRPEAALPYCEADRDSWYSQTCLAIAYHRLGRRKEAAAMLERMKAEQGTRSAFQYAEVYAQFGQIKEALQWLATAKDVKDPGLFEIKVDPFLDPIRRTPRFQEIVTALNLPR
jgi:TolB-like protein